MFHSYGTVQYLQSWNIRKWTLLPVYDAQCSILMELSNISSPEISENRHCFLSMMISVFHSYGTVQYLQSWNIRQWTLLPVHDGKMFHINGTVQYLQTLNIRQMDNASCLCYSVYHFHETVIALYPYYHIFRKYLNN